MEDGEGPVRLAISVADRSLADRLAALIAGIDGLEIVTDAAGADAVIITRNAPEPDTARVPGADDELLTARELEVLALLADGASNKAIARRLGISVHTAKFHVGSLIDKLDAAGRTDAVARAARRGVLVL